MSPASRYWLKGDEGYLKGTVKESINIGVGFFVVLFLGRVRSGPSVSVLSEIIEFTTAGCVIVRLSFALFETFCGDAAFVC